MYGQDGEPCPRCGTQITKARVGGRGTWYCPRCQPLPPAAPALASRGGRPVRARVHGGRRPGRSVGVDRGARPRAPRARLRGVQAARRRAARARRGRYLEVGCGSGADALGLASRFRVSVTGVDVSGAMVDEARRRGLRDAYVASAEALPFADSSFDGCWADRVFQHLSDPDAALAEMVRVTRPGGRIVVADPDYDTQVVDVPDQELARRGAPFSCGYRVAARDARASHGRAVRGSGAHRRRRRGRAGRPARPDGSRQCDGPSDVGRGRSRARRAASGGRGGVERAIDGAVAAGRFLYSFSVFLSAGTGRSTARRLDGGRRA